MHLNQIQDALTLSYRKYGGINRPDAQQLPSQMSVEALATAFMHLFFPGYFEEKVLNESDLDRHIRDTLEAIHGRLLKDVEKCLRFAQQTEASAKAKDSVATFLHEIASVRHLVMTDIDAAYAGDPAARSIEEVILAYPFVLVITLQRLAHVLYRLGIPLLPRMLTEYAHQRTGCDIHPGARLGPSLFIDHCTGVVIGETAVVGARVRIYQGVTLGAASFETDHEGRPVKGVKRHPEVGDNVTIYANATILGGATHIGARSIIGSNVWLKDSVPEDSVVCYSTGNTMLRREGTSKRNATAAFVNRAGITCAQLTAQLEPIVVAKAAT